MPIIKPDKTIISIAMIMLGFAPHPNLRVAMDDLDERNKVMLQARWLSEKKATLHELADHYGIFAERICQIEERHE